MFQTTQDKACQENTFNSWSCASNVLSKQGKRTKTCGQPLKHAKILQGGHIKGHQASDQSLSSSRSLLFTLSVTVLSSMFLFNFRYKSFLTV